LLLLVISLIALLLILSVVPVPPVVVELPSHAVAAAAAPYSTNTGRINYYCSFY